MVVMEVSEPTGPSEDPDNGEPMNAAQRGADLDAAILLQQARADRHRRLATAARLAVAALLVVTVIVVLAAVSGIGNPPIAVAVVLGVCWLIVLVRPPSIPWRP